MTDLNIPDTFLWSGVSSGVKKSGKPDLALSYSSYPATVSAVFTNNSFPAAPVRDARRRLNKSKQFRGLVVNSGVANAATGEAGLERNRELIEASASGLGLQGDEVLASSTGVIGEPLPVDTIAGGLPEAVDTLEEHPGSFAEAILTTDTTAKIASRSIPELDANMLGIAKGSGMIRPDMATMLAFVYLDYPVENQVWDRMLARACGGSFNLITVDGDMSTNDTVMAWAANLPNQTPVSDNSDQTEAVQSALTEVCRELAESIVLDGEGASRLIRVEVSGAPDDSIARDVADEVANSSLVKTAIHGGDPNWGRVFSSVGATGHELDPRELIILLNGYCVYDGAPAEPDDGIEESMKDTRQHIEIDLGTGEGTAEVLGCDLSAEYVTINSKYHT